MDLQAGLLYMQWSIEFMSGDHGAALIAARQLAAVTSRGSDTMRLAGDRILGTSLLFSGNLADAQDHLQRVVDFYVAPSDGHHATLFRRDPQVLARSSWRACSAFAATWTGPARRPDPASRWPNRPARGSPFLGRARCVVPHRADDG